jgi:hypothetical protein
MNRKPLRKNAHVVTTRRIALLGYPVLPQGLAGIVVSRVPPTADPLFDVMFTIDGRQTAIPLTHSDVHPSPKRSISGLTSTPKFSIIKG